MRKTMSALAAGVLLAGCVGIDDRRPVGVGVVIGGAPPAPVHGGGPPPWAPAHGRRAHEAQRYYYYPASSVYYSVATGSYFYLNGGGWQVGVSLPTAVVINPVDYVTVELDTDRPYLYYDEHRARFKGRRDHGHGHGGR